MTMTVVQPQNPDLHQRFCENLSLFPEYVRSQVQAVDLNEVWDRVQIVPSDEENHFICKYKDDNRWIQLNSMRPALQAQQWIHPIGIDTLGTFFLYGSGFGYALKEILSKAHPESIVIIFERDIHSFIAMLHVHDLRPIFRQHDKCIFFIGDTPDVIHPFSALLLTEHFYGLTKPAVVYAPETKIFKHQYSEIHQAIFELLAQHVFARGNDHYDSVLGFQNMIDNAPVVVANPYLRTLRNQFRNVPVFVVANGPSLDTNVQQLKKIEHKGLILCCESAIAALMRNGVHPDAIVVVERTPASYTFHFEHMHYPEDISLLALTLADPRIFRSFPGPKLPIFRSQESNSQWLSRILAEEEGLSGGINVSHLAYELAVYLGGNPIVLVGLDLAFGPGGMTHSKDSQYAAAGQDYIQVLRNSPVIYVEGNLGLPIPATVAWVDYRRWLEQMIQEHPEVTVINATEGGAKIQGTRMLPLSHVIDQFCTEGVPETLTRVLRDAESDLSVQHAQGRLDRLVLELRQYVEVYRALKQFAASASRASTKLFEAEELLDSSQRRKAFLETYKQNQREFHRFLQANVHHVFMQQAILYGMYQINRIGAINTYSKVKDALRVQVTMFDHLEQICTSLVNDFRIAAEKLLRSRTDADNFSVNMGGLNDEA